MPCRLLCFIPTSVPYVPVTATRRTTDFISPHKFPQPDLSSSLSLSHDTLDEWTKPHAFTLTIHLQAATEIKDFNQYGLNGFEDKDGVQLNNYKWMGRNTHTLMSSEHVCLTPSLTIMKKAIYWRARTKDCHNKTTHRPAFYGTYVFTLFHTLYLNPLYFTVSLHKLLQILY